MQTLNATVECILLIEVVFRGALSWINAYRAEESDGKPLLRRASVLGAAKVLALATLIIGFRAADLDVLCAAAWLLLFALWIFSVAARSCQSSGLQPARRSAFVMIALRALLCAFLVHYVICVEIRFGDSHSAQKIEVSSDLKCLCAYAAGLLSYIQNTNLAQEPFCILLRQFSLFAIACTVVLSLAQIASLLSVTNEGESAKQHLIAGLRCSPTSSRRDLRAAVDEAQRRYDLQRLNDLNAQQIAKWPLALKNQYFYHQYGDTLLQSQVTHPSPRDIYRSFITSGLEIAIFRREREREI